MIEPRRVAVGDLLDFRFPSRPVLDSSGARLAFVVQEADAAHNRYRSAIHLCDLPDAVPRLLTNGGSDSAPLWLDDGRLLFASKRERSGDRRVGDRGCDDAGDGAESVETGAPPADATAWWSIDPDGGEASYRFTIDRPVTWIRQLDAERFVVLTRFDPDPDAERARGQEGTEQTRVHAFDEAPVWSNGTGFSHGARTRLGVYDAARDELRDLSSSTMDCLDAALSPDRRRVALVATDRVGLKRPENRLYLCDLESGRVEDLSAPSELPTGIHGSPVFLDDRSLLFGFADVAERGINTSARLYRLDTVGERAAEVVLDPGDLRLGVNSVGTDVRLGTPSTVPVVACDGAIYAVGTAGHTSALYRIDEAGSIERLSGDDGSVDAFDVAGGSIAMVAMRDGRLPEVFTLEEGTERRLTTLNDEWFDAHVTSTPAPVDVTSGGVRIDAWVLMPSGSAGADPPARSIPAILDIHGGPRTVYGTVFSHEMQLWAAEGFAVIFANPHGSDGRGDDFADIRGRYGSVDYDDLMAVVDTALERYPAIDPDRLCVTGGSYGGFMTNWIIGHTDRFVAAASQRSIANWVTFWGTSDIGHYFGDDQTGTTPWADPQELWRQSPLAYADRVRTPALFVHSDADYRCWIPDAIAMHTALRYHDVESRLVWVEGENHELSRGGKPGPRIRRLEEITAWFARHAGLRETGGTGGAAASD